MIHKRQKDKQSDALFIVEREDLSASRTHYKNNNNNVTLNMIILINLILRIIAVKKSTIKFRRRKEATVLEDFYTGSSEISFEALKLEFFYGGTTTCCATGTCDR
ncbi:hypothetical protein [Helicobacter felis]|uniref:hypothetical protein n=1 Tax=Helicobacter felis TaxID=214 RepID=UPI000CEE37FD|nr:hypothetical protein [Helicobacter felis]